MSDQADSREKAQWPFRLDATAKARTLETEVRRATVAAQYGWGHTMDFGAFRVDGILGDQYLEIAGAFDAWGWWPRNPSGLVVADVGAFSGGLSLLAASRGAREVIAIDEVPEHLEQCRVLAAGLDVQNVRTLRASLYELPQQLEKHSVDVLILSGVLYHLSDMLVGLISIREVLKPGGTLLIETYAIECFEHSYANFGRFYGGSWWTPTALCVSEMLQFSGFADGDLRFYKEKRCLVRTTFTDENRILFKRGMNFRFEDLRDEVPRESATKDADRLFPPVPCDAPHRK